LLENADKFLVMDLLELDYDEDPSVIRMIPFDEDYLSVMRILSTPYDSDSWKHTSIFHFFIPINEKSCKLGIDGGSSMNVVSKSVVIALPLRQSHILIHLRYLGS